MPRFLTELQVLKMHDYLILLYGGESGVLDAAQLDSALNQPKAQFGGKFLHPTIPLMAAAYGFHISLTLKHQPTRIIGTPGLALNFHL